MSRRIVRSVTPCSSASAWVDVKRPASIRFRIFHCRITSALRNRLLLVEQEALSELHAQRDQRAALFLALDALGDHPGADLLAERAQRFQQAALDAALVDVAHQAHVELQELGLDRG